MGSVKPGKEDLVNLIGKQEVGDHSIGAPLYTGIRSKQHTYGGTDSWTHTGTDTSSSGIDNPSFYKNVVTGQEKEVDTFQVSKSEDVKDGDDDNDNDSVTGCPRCVGAIQNHLGDLYTSHKTVIRNIFYVTLLLLYIAYFSYAMYFRFGDEGSVRLLVVTALVAVGLSVTLLMELYGTKLGICWRHVSSEKTKRKASKSINIFLSVGTSIFAVVYVIVEIALKTPRNLVSAGGLATLVLLFYIFSVNPAKVKWRPVFWGLMLQFLFALIILRSKGGYDMFEWIGERFAEFIKYSDKGAEFVFGENYTDHFFAFSVLPVIVFFSTSVYILYYLGVMQFIIRNVARFLANALGTSPAESLNAAGNIFLGQTEAPLMIRPFLSKLTKSELHAVCTGGFATIAGSVMAAYILYGVPANHLLSASVMSAPAALAMSKLFYPETEKSEIESSDVYKMSKGPERNIVEAASTGATQSIKLVANVAVNLIAFVSLLEFANATLKWFGNRVGMEKPNDELTFEFICSYVFWPLAFMMGVDTGDCPKVAELVGIKTFINEFVAYTALSTYIKNAQNLSWYEGLAHSNNTNITSGVFNATWRYDNGDIVYDDLNITLIGGVLSERSVVISTYALCGFSNISSIGIMLGALGAMAPSRKSDLSQVVVRAMIAGNVACFMTACIAGLLYEGEL
ncbi:solute carrier family 28 member 3-like isoform X1 [Mizuhopecten yessoensis]|uniref:solute carrier family 28 member 3-like isoform X1 n=1 Tax=Mizuhopecten yessoensis TaxID=6573 RepID=UPI000B457CF7|nr:solute carrier family 28 member 3-like isoform X1 [Mizuhopecten yessoensis]